MLCASSRLRLCVVSRVLWARADKFRLWGPVATNGLRSSGSSPGRGWDWGAADKAKSVRQTAAF